MLNASSAPAIGVIDCLGASTPLPIFASLISLSFISSIGEKKFRVADVARALGVHRNAITLLYEETANRVDIDNIDKLCAFLDCGIQDLFEYMPDGEK